MAFSWFLYNGVGSTTEATNYNQVGSTPLCNDGANICAVFAEVQLLGNPQVPRPIITSTLSSDVITADTTNTPSANVRLKF